MGADPIVGVVLAGGKGSRLGGSKAGMRLPGVPPERPGPTLVEWAVTRLAAVDGVGEILVAAGETGVDTLSFPLETCGLPSVVADGPGSGPAAGLLGAERVRPGRNLLALACDLPLAPVDLLAALAASRADLAAAAADPADPWSMNPTCALWKPAALALLERRVAAGDFRLYPTLQNTGLQVQAIDAGRFGDPKRVLLNVNTAADWNCARRAFRDGLPEARSTERSEATSDRKARAPQLPGLGRSWRCSAADRAVRHSAHGQSRRRRSKR